jgi:hypothetical protein
LKELTYTNRLSKMNVMYCKYPRRRSFRRRLRPFSNPKRSSPASAPVPYVL